MTDEKKVSVIMATYNTPKEFIVESIESILNQTYKNIEMIIICDGSKEEFDYLNGKYGRENRIKLFLNDENKGLPYSLNKAIDVSTGEYIARMDSDDISLPNRIKLEVDFMEKNNHIALVGMFAKKIGDQKGDSKIFLYKPQEIEIQLLYRACLIHPTVMFRKSYLMENNLKYNEEFKCSQDFEFWTRIEKDANIAIIPKIGLKYRMHKKQATRAKAKIQEEFCKKILEQNTKIFFNIQQEEIRECLMQLSRRKKTTLDNYLHFSRQIDMILKNNSTFDYCILKKVLYYRFFHILLTDKILTIKNLKILKNKEIRQKVFRFYNIKYLFFVLHNRIKTFFIRKGK